MKRPSYEDWMSYMLKMRDKLRVINQLQYDKAIELYSLVLAASPGKSLTSCSMIEWDEENGPSFHMSWSWGGEQNKDHTFFFDIYPDGEVEWFYKCFRPERCYDASYKEPLTELPQRVKTYLLEE